MNKRQQMAEMRKAVQLFLSTMDVETQSERMLEVASAFPAWKTGVAYKVKDVFRYGENMVGDAQLYQVLQDHVSAEDWTPEIATSLYKAIGITEDGVPEWVQPLGATDAYNTGDRVWHKDKLWESNVDNNSWEPGVYGWVEVTS